MGNDTSAGGIEHGYLFTEVDYHHPYDAPDAESVAVMNWFQPHGLRTVQSIGTGAGQ